MAGGKQPDIADEDGGDDAGGGSLFADINITPLTDVFLVMVVIFMVAALAVQVERNQEKREEKAKQDQAEIEKRSGIKINLPSGQAQELDPEKAQPLVLGSRSPATSWSAASRWRTTGSTTCSGSRSRATSRRRSCSRPTRASRTGAWSGSWSAPSRRA